MKRSPKGTAIRMTILRSFVFVILLTVPGRVAAYNIEDDDDAYSHEVMTKQAHDLYLFYTQAAPTPYRPEINTYWDSIQEGVGDPDREDAIYGNSGLQGALTTINHFWQPDSSLGKPMDGLNTLGDDDYPNAFQAAQTYWMRALGYYQAGNKSEAYRHLGMVAHYLGDQTIPTHAHNDTHGPDFLDDDAFEEWMSESGPRESDDPRPIIVHGDESPNAVLYNSEKASLQGEGPLLPPVGLNLTEINDRFLWIFLRTNQIADCYASDEVDGNFTHPSDPRVAGWVQAEIAAVQAAHAAHPGGFPLTTERLEANDEEYIDEDLNTFGGNNSDYDGDLSLIREGAYVPGIRAIAALFALWEETISVPVLTVTVHQIREIGEDTFLGTYGMDGYGKPDFYAGIIMGPNQGRSSYLQYEDGYAPYLEDRDGLLRNINGAPLPGSVTRYDAFQDTSSGGTEDATTVNPNYLFGRSYVIPAGGYVVGTDIVKVTLSIWENDETGDIFLEPYTSDDPADIGLGTGTPLPIVIDLGKCEAGALDAVTVGANTYPTRLPITWKGTGDNDNDVQVVFSVRLGSYGFVSTLADSGAGSLRNVIGEDHTRIRFLASLDGGTISLTTGDITVPTVPIKISGQGLANQIKISATQPTRIGPAAE
jgi:hypothetical protein